MKKYIFLISILASLNMTFLAQQEYQLANSIFNPYLLNPAAGGMTDVMHFEFAARSQWTGYEGNPQTFIASGNSQFSMNNKEKKVIGEFNQKDELLFESPKITVAKKKHVIGAKAWNDAIGPFTKTSFQGSYAYHLPLTNTLNFGVGLGMGWSHFSINQDKIKVTAQNDLIVTQQLGNTSRQNMIDAQAGIIIYGKRFYFGFSSTQFFNNSVVFGNTITTNRFNRHYFTMLKYKTSLTEKLSLEPSVVLKSVKGSPISFDLGIRLISKERSWATVLYRNGGGLVFQLGSNLIKNTYLCYAYEYGVGKLRLTNNGTHEIQLGWYLGKNRNIEEELKKMN